MSTPLTIATMGFISNASFGGPTTLVAIEDVVIDNTSDLLLEETALDIFLQTTDYTLVLEEDVTDLKVNSSGNLELDT